MGLLSAWAVGRWPQAQHEAWLSGVASRLMRMATSFSYRSLVESSDGVEKRTAAVSQTAGAGASAQTVGVWFGKSTQGLPAVTL
jgi:hypothetical protein